jgi:inner membrane protein
MPSIGHLAVGLAAARVHPSPKLIRQAIWAALLVAFSFLPDVDVIAFDLRIPYGAPFGHRGALHSLTLAMLLAAVVAVPARLGGASAWRFGLVVAAVLVSHDLLDTLTDGGRGIALFWPFSSRRVFAPWRPIPVAPIGLNVLSVRGLRVMLREALLFLPLFVVAVWPQRRRTS